MAQRVRAWDEPPLSHALGVVAWSAERLPVALGPEALSIALVWLDVVDDGCWPWAVSAARVAPEPDRPLHAPSAIVASSVEARPGLVSRLPCARVLLAGTTRHEAMASRMGTRAQGGDGTHFEITLTVAVSAAAQMTLSVL